MSNFPNLLGQIHTYIYLAAANQMIFRQGEALASLRQALDMAMPDRVLMPFVENCDYLKPLLEELYGQGVWRDGIARILELYGPYGRQWNKSPGSITFLIAVGGRLLCILNYWPASCSLDNGLQKKAPGAEEL